MWGAASDPTSPLLWLTRTWAGSRRPIHQPQQHRAGDEANDDHQRGRPKIIGREQRRRKRRAVAIGVPRRSPLTSRTGSGVLQPLSVLLGMAVLHDFHFVFDQPFQPRIEPVVQEFRGIRRPRDGRVPAATPTSPAQLGVFDDQRAVRLHRRRKRQRRLACLIHRSRSATAPDGPSVTVGEPLVHGAVKNDQFAVCRIEYPPRVIRSLDGVVCRRKGAPPVASRCRLQRTGRRPTPQRPTARTSVSRAGPSVFRTSSCSPAKEGHEFVGAATERLAPVQRSNGRRLGHGAGHKPKADLIGNEMDFRVRQQTVPLAKLLGNGDLPAFADPNNTKNH